MIKIDKHTGSSLMRIWGVTNWPTIDADYFLWRGCAVYALIDKGNFIDLHIAMQKKSRRKCREFVKHIQNNSSKPLRALIEIKNKHVCNLAKKMGFHYVDTYPFELLDGTITKVIEMRY